MKKNEETMKAKHETEVITESEMELKDLEKVAAGVMNGGGTSNNHGTGSAG